MSGAEVGPTRSEVHESWSCLHFSVANPRADGACDLPRLLGRLAGSLEDRRIGPADILDVTNESEISEDGPWWSATVCWSADPAPVEPSSPGNMEPVDAARRGGRVEEVLGRPVGEMAATGAVERRASFVDFYRSSLDRLAGALALTLGDSHLGTEAADEAMARAYQRWDRVGAYDDPSAWVYRVGHNWAVSALRRRRRRPEVEEGADDPAPIAEPTVTAALAELPVGQRAVIVCRFSLGLSVAETAAALQIRPGTVKSRLSRGLQRLQVRLAHLRFEEQP